MKLKHLFTLGVFPFFLTSLFYGCGSDDPAATTTTTTLTTSSALSSVPAATGEVTSSSSVSKFNSKFFKDHILPRLASTGLTLSSAGSSVTFSSGNSTALCETTTILKSVLRDVAQPDKILCYMGAMAANSIIPTSFADGNWHYVQLVNLPDAGGTNTTPYVKTRIVLTDGIVTDFKMFSCFGGTSASPVQTEYISMVNANNSGTVLSKYTGSESGSTFSSTTTATGTVNSSGAWLDSKNVVASNYFTDGSSSFNMAMNLTQTNDQVTISGTQNGSFSFGNSTQTFSNSLYTVAQILNASALNTFAVGDGTSKYNVTFSDGNTNYSSGESTESWNGDSLNPLSTASDGDFYTSANAGTLPSIPTSVSTVSFDSEEQWDCALPSGETWVEADFNNGGTGITSAMSTCNTGFEPGSDWVDCSATYGP